MNLILNKTNVLVEKTYRCLYVLQCICGTVFDMYIKKCYLQLLFTKVQLVTDAF